jgi:hypothetical protein
MACVSTTLLCAQAAKVFRGIELSFCTASTPYGLHVMVLPGPVNAFQGVQSAVEKSIVLYLFDGVKGGGARVLK